MEKKTKINPIDLELVCSSMKDITDKAALALYNVTDQYFNRYKPSNDAAEITFIFPEAALYCSIAEDYIADLQNRVKELEKITYSILENK